MILPDKDEADRYCTGLETDEGWIGKLSDQDYVSYHFREKYVLLHMNMCVFFSWLNHNDVMQDHIKDVCKLSMSLTDWKRWEHYWTTKSFASEFLDQYGMVHASSAFDTIKTRSRNKLMNEFMGRGELVTKVKVAGNKGYENLDAGQKERLGVDVSLEYQQYYARKACFHSSRHFENASVYGGRG